MPSARPSGPHEYRQLSTSTGLSGCHKRCHTGATRMTLNKTGTCKLEASWPASRAPLPASGAHPTAAAVPRFGRPRETRIQGHRTKVMHRRRPPKKKTILQNGVSIVAASITTTTTYLYLFSIALGHSAVAIHFEPVAGTPSSPSLEGQGHRSSHTSRTPRGWLSSYNCPSTHSSERPHSI